MAAILPGAIRKDVGRPIHRGPQVARKIGLVGTYTPTLWMAPWSDPSWEFWGNTSAVNKCPPGRLDLLIDTHPKFAFQDKKKNGFKDYYEFLQRCRTPILMQDQYVAIPASVRYPIEQVETEFGRELIMRSMTAELLALAMIWGVTDIGLWGVEYGHQTEKFDGQDRFYQRDDMRMWIGIAIGRGIKIHTPEHCTLVYAPRGTKHYGYHLTPEAYEIAKQKQAEAFAKAKVPFDRTTLKDMTCAEDFAEAEATRRRDPDYVKEIDAFTANEVIPDDLISHESGIRSRRRDDHDAERHGVGVSGGGPGAATPEGLPPGGAGVQGDAPRPFGAGDQSAGGVDAGGRGGAPGSGDGVLQPGVPASAKRAHQRATLRHRRPAGRRKAVAGVRHATRRRDSGRRGRTKRR